MASSGIPATESTIGAGSASSGASDAVAAAVSPGRSVNPKLVLLLVCVAQFVLLVDDTIVNVALPTIGDDLDFTESSLSWVTNAYFLTFGGFLLIGGGLADLLGRRRLFGISLVLFVLASAVCGIAPDSGVLIGARAAQGIAGALLSPAALAILLATFRQPAERARALGTWAALTGLGAATGLLLGGALVEWAHWRWIFLINLPIGALTLLALPRVIGPDDREAARRVPDFAGAAIGTAAVLTLVYTVVETPTHPWSSTRTLLGLAVAAVLALGFALRQRSAAEPLLPRALLRMRHLVLADVLVLVAAGGLFAMFFFLTLYMQRIQGWSPMDTGLAFLPFSVGMGLGAAVSTKLIANRGPLLPVSVGPAIAAGGMWLMSRLDEHSSYTGHLLPALVVTGLGLGVAFVAIIHTATGGAGEGEGGVASAMVTTCQQLGAAVGIAVLVTVATNHTKDRMASGVLAGQATVDGFSRAFEIQAGLMGMAALLGIVVGVATERHHAGRE
ncbi:MFS transporter [Embleya scabrispora]|uniref:MFS transporter n=1 Tax=Embleya scabrispora TaxID=159449 RepID=UPI00037AEB8F|nr:MFS transporter [Embleya scabrispora]MYS78775.1 MFS transporter [Streptomyces sp. SID5474]